MNQAKQAIKQKAAAFIEDAIQDIFVQKHVDTKRILPSIQNLNIVSNKNFNTIYLDISYIIVAKGS